MNRESLYWLSVTVLTETLIEIVFLNLNYRLPFMSSRRFPTRRLHNAETTYSKKDILRLSLTWQLAFHYLPTVQMKMIYAFYLNTNKCEMRQETFFSTYTWLTWGRVLAWKSIGNSMTARGRELSRSFLIRDGRRWKGKLVPEDSVEAFEFFGDGSLRNFRTPQEIFISYSFALNIYKTSLATVRLEALALSPTFRSTVTTHEIPLEGIRSQRFMKILCNKYAFQIAFSCSLSFASNEIVALSSFSYMRRRHTKRT